MTRGVSFRQWAEEEIQKIHQAGLFKNERVILSPQGSDVQTSEGAAANFCANNYLGLGNHPEILEAAREGLETHGYGMASVRFICGTQDLHKQLEEKISGFLGTDDTILYSSCFDANGGLFETILGADDCVISDELNHASIIDGIRLSKARRKIYRHADMAHLEEQLQASRDCRFCLIASDGVFSMQGDLAPLPEMVRLAEQYDALIMIDECHATGLLGASGRGTPEHFDLHGRMDVITGTLGKALGGASGGFTSGRQEIVDLLRQRSRPYLFSNTIAPPLAAGSIKALELLEKDPSLLCKLQENTRYFRSRMTERGFQIPEGIHPIVPILIGNEKTTGEMAADLSRRGIFVVGFSFPVVPRGQAQIRVQVSAAHSGEQLDFAVEQFEESARALEFI